MGPFRAAEVVNQESDDTGITATPGQMKVAQELWRGKYLGIKDWWGDIDEQITKYRKLTTPYGRVREFYGFINEHLLKEATATVPQSTSVDYINRGMLRVYKELVEKGAYGLELLHQNHDSILVQFDEGKEDEVKGEVSERLLSVVQINGHDVTIPVEGAFGKNWGDYHAENNPEGLREAA
jgi:DNA polymerase I-like protein with 3'-5' exonuclease and polymerase domains